MINIGILGAAKIAPKGIIWPAKDREDCQVVAVASRSLEKAKAFANEHNIPNALSDYDALITQDDIDLIYNALPPHRHADLSIAALKNGKSVLCEKPFAMNASEAKAMVEATEASKGHLIEAFHYRYHPAALRFFDLAHNGTIGNITSMQGIFNVSISNRPGELRYRAELGGGAMMDLGCYVLHMMRLVTRSDPVIQTATAVKDSTNVDVAMDAYLEFDGVKSHLQCDMREGTERAIQFRVEGDAGYMVFDQFIHPYRDFKIDVYAKGRNITLTHEADPKAYNRTTYEYQLDHVMDIMNNHASPLTGGLDSLRTMKAIDNIYRAAGFDR